MELATQTAAALAETFRELAAARGRARSPEVANSYFDQSIDIYRELRGRGTDALQELVRLLRDHDDEVALHAASLLLGTFPSEASKTLDRLSAVSGLVGFTAQMTLREWKAGRLELPD